jgi:vacuolar protein sorting-associated protein 53
LCVFRPTTTSTSSYSSISEAANSLIQNFQIQNMIKDNSQLGNAVSSAISGGNSSAGGSSTTPSSGMTQGTSTSSSSLKYNETEICKVCSILCTAEYCLETTQQLEDKLKEKLSTPSSPNSKVNDEDNKHKINFTNEKDVFMAVISSSIQLLVIDIENSCEPALNAMTKISWHNFSVVGDQSSYISAIINHIKNFVPIVRDNLTNSRKYFTQFCSKFVINLITRFVNNILKCRSISQIGIEQLLLDSHSLKTFLVDMPTINSNINRKSPVT